MASEGGKVSTSRDLDQTPTWAVAGVCAVIIIISIALEKFLHKIGTWLTARHKRSLHEALEVIKAELMILGFISLILVFSQYYIADICIPIGVANTMLPCPLKQAKAKAGNLRRLLSYERRGLAAKKEPSCKDGHVALISVNGLHQIHVLLFFLAVFHMIYSAITMTLGRLKGCFFRQFFKSVSKSDYLTVRNGFIAVHLAPGSKFNFQKYIKRSLEDDFKRVVGVSPVLWGSFVVFLLLNVSGWQALFWASLIPVVLILAVGTKLQAILTNMALEITERHAVVQGMPLVQGSDKYFWFSKPHLVLHLIHFALFQYTFGLRSCFHDNFELLIAKICLGVGVLFLCSYSTLPLYSLVAQMGSHMKKSIFDEQTSKALDNWRMAVKKKHGERSERPSTRALGGGGSPTSSMGSPFHPTRDRTNTTSGHSTLHDDPRHASDLENQTTQELPGVLMIGADHVDRENQTKNTDDFSFDKSAANQK
ncbi:hypothetical protein RD792_010315 [Penstemon davidsonii]|uniref:MLO-like protein n=1 Tax=Penstemon davidsonii TaxID=160366 RepID=A0ABR0D1I1_9LAMI|nr:hypothetical protein RD792_010315 [Penstemon davidsonii]